MKASPTSAHNPATKPGKAEARERVLERRLHLGLWATVIVMGLVHAWAGRYVIEPDGISYLDIADKYLVGDWRVAVNAYWSPLYSWILAGALFLFRPSPYWEYPLVHAVNFVIYLGAFGSFQFLLSQLMRFQRMRANESNQRLLSPYSWHALGCVLFLWCSLFLISLPLVTPDMCVAALVFLASGLLLRIKMQSEGWRDFLLLGLVLGVAYLAKAVMFPLAFAFFIICFFSVGNVRRASLRILATIIVFGVISAPFIIVLSQSKGRWTFSDTGRLAYAWLVDGTDPYIHWQGQSPASGTATHPTNKILEFPAVYEFKEPLKVTYAPWYDPSYWNEGLVGHFNLRGQIKVFGAALLQYYAVFINSPIGMAILVSFLGLLLFTTRKVRESIVGIEAWPLLLVGLTALGLYALVHVETRYIAPFVVLVWLFLFSKLRLRGENARVFTSSILTAMTVVCMGVMVAKTLAPSYALAKFMLTQDERSSAKSWEVSDGLAKLGLQPGEQIGSIAYGFSGLAFSARLAKVRIIAEITSGSDIAPKEDVDKFWCGSPDTQRRVIEAFAKTGAKAIVANRLPAGLSPPAGWQRIGNTDHYIYFLR
jgi:hypothetical protein